MISCVKSSDFWHFLYPCLAFEHQRLCDILERTTATISSFTNAKTHSPAEQPYSCSKCVKKFPLPHDLKEHERTHCAEPFRCLQCDKRFSLFDELKQHKRSHVGEEPFNCTKCDKKFALGSDMKEPTLMKSHSVAYSVTRNSSTLVI